MANGAGGDISRLNPVKIRSACTVLALIANIMALRAEDVASKVALTLHGAKRVGEAAMKYAKDNGCAPSIAVVDAGGYLLYFIRPEDSFAAGANLSLGKARTAAIFKKPTKDFEDTINQGRFTMTALPDFTPLQGGIPIVHDGQIIGAIGCSGAKSAAQDEEVAKAGAAALSDAREQR
jgi:glc operon protein GlcG